MKEQPLSKNCNPSICKKIYEQYSVTEYCSYTTGSRREEVTVEGFETDISCVSPPARILYFESGWGREYGKREENLKETRGFYIENTRGRASHQYHPFCIITCEDNTLMLLALAWSGNWYINITEDGKIKAGQTAEMFTRILKAGEEYYSPPVLAAEAEDGSINTLADRMHRFGREVWFNYNAESQSLWTEWNPWWTYEDSCINEEVFLRNADRAAELGIELCTLDAGWFGTPSNITWSKLQGDWGEWNRERFPRGIRCLSDYIHAKGMKFGIWMEPEALGAMSELRIVHPEWEALRDGRTYENPYLCLGNREAREWLFAAMSELIEDTGCDHIKLDFNLDPELGCNREDHGHQAGDGLNAHYEGYYQVLEDLGRKYPHLVIENCSSGGLRTDYGMLKRTHTTFLSDVDISAHSLNCFWYLSLLLPPEKILHWVWSETREYEDGTHVFESLPIEEDTEDYRIKYAVRAAMLHQIGFSRNLTALPYRCFQIIKRELDFYKLNIRPLLLKGKLYHLLNKDGIYGFLIKDKMTGYLFLYNTNRYHTNRINAGDRTVKDYLSLILEGYEEHIQYRIEDIDTGNAVHLNGTQLKEQGLTLDCPGKESAAVYKITAVK